MTERIPPAARRLLDQGVFAYLAARSRRGPHLTPFVFVRDGRSLWLTTSRSSAKTWLWRRDPRVAGMVRTNRGAVTFRGSVRIYDAFDPLTWPAAAVGAPRLIRAGTRFGLKNARFFAGYAMDAYRVPWAWAPVGRIFVQVDLDAGRVLHPDGTADGGWSDWRGAAPFRRSFRAVPGPDWLSARVPPQVGDVIGNQGSGALAVDGGQMLTVLPVAWRWLPGEGMYEASVARSLATVADPGRVGHLPASLCIDGPSAWRATDMTGLMVGGRAEMYGPEVTGRGRDSLMRRLGELEGVGSIDRGSGGSALVRLRPERAVWWEAWSSGTIEAPLPSG